MVQGGQPLWWALAEEVTQELLSFCYRSTFIKMFCSGEHGWWCWYWESCCQHCWWWCCLTAAPCLHCILHCSTMMIMVMMMMIIMMISDCSTILMMMMRLSYCSTMLMMMMILSDYSTLDVKWTPMTRMGTLRRSMQGWYLSQYDDYDEEDWRWFIDDESNIMKEVKLYHLITSCKM